MSSNSSFLSLFTNSELEAFATPYPDRIIKHIQQKEIEEALAICEEMKKSRIVLHDFFADSCTVLWSWIGDQLGEEIIEDLFRYIFEQSARRQIYSLAILFRMYLPNTISLLAESGWRSHSCFGYGEHPAQFSITEDEEKFTFHLHPCASGVRLFLRGMYEPGRGGKLTEKAYPWTFNRKGFPYYCIHSAFLNEILPYETFGYLMWPTDEPQEPAGPCRWHIYKDPNDIPDKYYDRLGVKKNILPAVAVKRQKKFYFTVEELTEMCRPMTARIQENIHRGDSKEAIKLCRNVKDEFLFLHDLYVNMIVATLTFISDRAGEPGLGEALEYQFEKVVKPLLNNLDNLSTRDIVLFLALKIFGVDNCHQTGLPKGKFTIEETDNSIIFKLNPCGSGGRLLKGGAYKPMSSWQKWRESRVDSLFINTCRFFPLSDRVLKWSFSDTGGYVTQRKPYGQGKTKSMQAWSFGKKNIPYYCCQCGMLNKKLTKACLEISPPEDENAPCIWRIKKKS